MVRPCPPTMAPPSAFGSGGTSAGKIPNFFLESSSQTARTITGKAAAPGTEAFEADFLSPMSGYSGDAIWATVGAVCDRAFSLPAQEETCGHRPHLQFQAC